MSKGHDNPMLILPVVIVDMVPLGPSSHVAGNWARGVLLRLDGVLEDQRGFDAGFNHRSVPVLFQLADA